MPYVKVPKINVRDVRGERDKCLNQMRLNQCVCVCVCACACVYVCVHVFCFCVCRAVGAATVTTVFTHDRSTFLWQSNYYLCS